MTYPQLAVNGQITAFTVITAVNFWKKFIGLMGRTGTRNGLLLPQCGSIHTFFMRFAIDAVFIDSNNRVISVTANLKPWRISFCHGAQSVLELPGGKARELNIVAGATLTFR